MLSQSNIKHFTHDDDGQNNTRFNFKNMGPHFFLQKRGAEVVDGIEIAYQFTLKVGGLSCLILMVQFNYKGLAIELLF